LLASRSFCEVLSSLSPHYARLFTREGLRTDKHVREHEVYSVARDVRARVRGAAPAPAADPTLLHRAADVFDAGAHLIISGYTQSSVQDALDKFAQGGSRMISDITPVGNKWVAACEHPLAPVSACKVEHLGHTRIVTGPTQQAVSAKVEELVEFGAVVVREIEFAGGVWTAVCEVREAGR
jgi:hypothetical protein